MYRVCVYIYIYIYIHHDNTNEHNYCMGENTRKKKNEKKKNTQHRSKGLSTSECSLDQAYTPLLSLPVTLHLSISIYLWTYVSICLIIPTCLSILPIFSSLSLKYTNSPHVLTRYRYIANLIDQSPIFYDCWICAIYERYQNM